MDEDDDLEEWKQDLGWDSKEKEEFGNLDQRISVWGSSISLSKSQPQQGLVSLISLLSSSIRCLLLKEYIYIYIYILS